MKYYLIFLYGGQVMDICSYDEKEARDSYFNTVMFNPTYAHPTGYDDVQRFDIVV